MNNKHPIQERLDLENELKKSIYNLIQYHSQAYITADENGFENQKNIQGKKLEKYRKIEKTLNI